MRLDAAPRAITSAGRSKPDRSRARWHVRDGVAEEGRPDVQPVGGCPEPRVHGEKAKRITVVGYAFLDLSHQCAAFPKAGCRYGGDRVRTLWEIHPVLTLAWAK
jgi:hypothetical protein